ncbi:MAG TPA: LytTR family DNA-binding domain-containing protein, partial [Taishania sp.]|nr:LytTR family DNA-binding domain-containing protein [Taishania sp.]
MKIVIIEDEDLLAEDLSDILKEIDNSIEIVKHISSVKEGVQFFNSTEETIDLIFSDIQLGDGLSFDLFKATQLNVPVIFCTAYNQYAINAFKANGIEYILKPFSTKTITEALERYKNLKNNFTENIRKVEQQLQPVENQNNTLVVHHKDKIIPLNREDIALVYIRNEQVTIRNFEGEQYYINKSLDELDQLLGDQFYRANRQFIVNKNAVKDITTLINRKYLVNLNFEFKQQIVVSKEKMSSF